MSLNFQETYDKNISKLLQDAEVFGLGWLGDGATIKCMPLLNILVLCGPAPSTVVSIVDCTLHMSDGRKKDGGLDAEGRGEREGQGRHEVVLVIGGED